MKAKFALSCFWSLINNSKANLIAFCKFLFVFIHGRWEIWAQAGAEVEAQKTVNIRVKMPLFLIKVLKASLVNLFLLVEGKLHQIHSLAIWLARLVVLKIFIKFLFFF